MKYLLIAAALSFGFCGTCLAGTSIPTSKPSAHSASTSPQYPNGPQASANKCHMEGPQLVCKST